MPLIVLRPCVCVWCHESFDWYMQAASVCCCYIGGQIVLPMRDECVKRSREGLLKCFHYKRSKKQYTPNILLCYLMCQLYQVNE